MWLAAIWLIFAIMFLALGCFQWKMAGNGISHFHINKRPLKQRPGIEIEVKIAGSDVDQPLEEFVADFNGYIDDYNQTTNKEHKTQAIGYWVASATAILSSVLAMFS
jgi:hypothetical protein